MSKIIVYIHGAMSSPTAFQYFKESFPEHHAVLISYDSSRKFTEGLEKIRADIHAAVPQGHEFDIVSHSLGGLMAVNLAADRNFNVGKLVTISAPFGGSEVAAILKWLYPLTSFFRDISSYSKFILQTRRAFSTARLQLLDSQKKFLPIVTHCEGSVTIKKQNDLIVTVDSQTILPTSSYRLVNHNHFEVLQSVPVKDGIQHFLWST